MSQGGGSGKSGGGEVHAVFTFLMTSIVRDEKILRFCDEGKFSHLYSGAGGIPVETVPAASSDPWLRPTS